jgi:hypothetical protein
MADDDDDGDADDSPTVQYTHQDSLKGKTIPESGQTVGSKLEGLEVSSMLVSPPLLTHPPSQTDYRSHLHLPGSISAPSTTLPVSADRHTQPHASSSRVVSSSISYTAQSPNPRKRVKVDDRPSTVASPILGGFPPRSESDPSFSSRALHLRGQPPHAPFPPHPYQPGFFPGFSSHVSATASPGNGGGGGGLHTSASFPSPTGGSSMGAPPLHLVQPYESPRHPQPQPQPQPPRITQPHFGPNTDDLFANVFGPAGGSGVGLDPESDFLASPLTFDWPQFAPTTQAGGSGGQHGHSASDSSPTSWLDFLSGAAPDAPHSPRTGKRSRGDVGGVGGGASGEGPRGTAGGSG